MARSGQELHHLPGRLTVKTDALSRPQIWAAILGFLVFVGPAMMVVIGAFRSQAFGDSSWSVAHVQQVFTRPETYAALWETFRLSLTITLISTPLAILFALISSRTNLPFRQLVPLMMGFVVATPSLFYAISWSSLGNPRTGIINDVFVGMFGQSAGIVNTQSWWGVVFVSVLKATAIQYFLLIGPFLAVDRSMEEAARISGASPMRTFFGIQIPILLPAITGAVILSLILFLEAFDIPQILGVPAGIYVLPTEMFAYLQHGNTPNYGAASALALLLLAILVILVAVQRKALGGRDFATVSGKGSKHDPWDLGVWRWPLAAMVMLYALMSVVMPILELVILSLLPYAGARSGFSLQSYERILGNPALMAVLRDTAIIGISGGALAAVTAAWMLWAASLRKGKAANAVSAALWVTIAIPGLILGLGVLWYFLNVPGLSIFYGTPLIVGFGLFISAVPIATRALEGGLVQLKRELQEAAWVSGVSRLGGFSKIIIPNLLPSLLSAWLLCFVLIVGNLAIPILLSAPGARTASVEIYTLYTSGRGPAAAAIFILLFVILFGFALAISALRMWLVASRARKQQEQLNPDNI